MTALLKTILFDEFASIDVTRFRTLSEIERLEHSGESGMALDYRVVLKVKSTTSIETTLRQGFTSGVNLGSVEIASLSVGGRYLSGWCL